MFRLTLCWLFKPNVATYRHLNVFIKHLPPCTAEFISLEDFQSSLPDETIKFFETVYKCTIFDVVKFYSQFVHYPVAFFDNSTGIDYFKLRLRRPCCAFDMLLHDHVADLDSWVPVAETVAKFEPILVERKQSLVEFIRQHPDPWMRLSWDERWVCEEKWFIRSQSLPSPVTFESVFSHQDPTVELRALPNEVGAFLDYDEENSSVGFLAQQLSPAAVAELKMCGFRGLLDFFKAHSTMYELSDGGKTVRSLRRTVPDPISKITDQTLTPLIEYIPLFWIPLFQVEAEIEKSDPKLLLVYKDKGSMNGLLDPVSGVEVKSFRGTLRSTPLVIVRRVHREVGISRPCVIPTFATEYRITKKLVRALEAAMSDVTFKKLEELSEEVPDVASLKWPLDVLCSFFPKTFELREEVGSGMMVRSRRNDPDPEVAEGFLRSCPKLGRVMPMIRQGRNREKGSQSRSVLSRRREARRSLIKGGLSLSQKNVSEEQISECVLKHLPAMASRNLMDVSHEMAKSYPHLHQMVLSQFGGLKAFVKRHPHIFTLEEIPGNMNYSIRRSEGIVSEQDKNPYFEEEMLLEVVKATITEFHSRKGRNPGVMQLASLLSHQPRKALTSAFFGGAWAFVEARPHHFTIVHALRRDDCEVSLTV